MSGCPDMNRAAAFLQVQDPALQLFQFLRYNEDYVKGNQENIPARNRRYKRYQVYTAFKQPGKIQKNRTESNRGTDCGYSPFCQKSGMGSGNNASGK